MTNTLLQVSNAYLGLIRSYCSDQDQDHDPDLNLKTRIIDQDQDQDRSQIQNILQETESEQLNSWFRNICRQYDVLVDGLDLSSIRRNITWVKANIDAIKYPRAYLGKIVAGCPAMAKPAAGPKVGFRVPSVPDEAIPSDQLLGIPRTEIAAKADQYTEDIHQRLMPLLGDAMARLYPTYSSISGSSLRLNILVAQAIKEGLL